MTIHFNDLSKGLPEVDLLRVEAPRAPGFYRRHGKRALDLFLVISTAFLTVPLILIAAALVALEGGAPFYSQPRIGRDGKVFRLWKLRTMVPDADAVLAAYLAENPEARREWERTQKLKNDPRITRVGRFLRKTSLDELPQLWNVLRGEMSLIGPRPMMCGQQALYPGTAYYRMLPGLSGFWQISERNEGEFRSRAMFDLQYERAMSLWTDLRVILRTIGVVLRCTGY